MWGLPNIWTPAATAKATDELSLLNSSPNAPRYQRHRKDPSRADHNCKSCRSHRHTNWSRTQGGQGGGGCCDVLPKLKLAQSMTPTITSTLKIAKHYPRNTEVAHTLAPPGLYVSSACPKVTENRDQVACAVERKFELNHMRAV